MHLEYSTHLSITSIWAVGCDAKPRLITNFLADADSFLFIT
jgi:hypothetical protein